MSTKKYRSPLDRACQIHKAARKARLAREKRAARQAANYRAAIAKADAK